MSPSPAAPTAGVRLVRGHWLFAFVLIVWLCSLCGIWFLNGLLVWSVGLLYVLYDTWLIAYVSLRARGAIVVREAGAAEVERGPLPTLAVVVAARNEAFALPATLDALLGQDDRPDDILLVDDGSIDGTHEMLSRRYPGVRVLSKPNTGKADSLNQALRHIGCEIVVTLDADTVLEPGAIRAMRRAFAGEPQLAAASGVLTPLCKRGRFFEWFQTFEYLRAFLSRAAWMRADALLLVSGAFAGYRRSVLTRVGGFDPLCLVEDYELIHRLHRYAAVHGQHWTVRVLPQAAATTDAPATLGAFLRQRRRWFAGFLQTQYKNRDMTGNPFYGSVGRFMLPIKVIDTLQPLYGLTAFVLLVVFLVRGSPVLQPVLAVILVKIAVDLCFQLWAVRLYHSWIGRVAPPRKWVLAMLASFAEPFSFQLMRHGGALLGWFSILTHRVGWAPQRVAVFSTGVDRE